jgi:PilZ domain
MNEPRSREKRRSPRVSTSKGIWVSWKTEGGPATVSRVRDLSAGGALIAADTPAPVGAAIKLLFALPEGELRFDSVVRYSDSKRMGVEFKRMSATARARLQELLRRLSR